MSKSILVGVANIGQQNFLIDIVEKWKPEKISFLGDTVFFKVEDTFFSMNKQEFCAIFRENCGFIKF